MFKILIGVVVAVFVVIVAFMVIDPNIGTIHDGISDSASLNTFALTIEGEIQRAGTYVLSQGATMGDLIISAGGQTSNTDELAYFDTAELKSGMTYYIAPKYDLTDVCNNVEIKKVNINKDTQEKMMGINGITASIANSIVSYRSSNGQFFTLESLMDVYGIGNATYKKVRNYITLHE